MPISSYLELHKIVHTKLYFIFIHFLFSPQILMLSIDLPSSYVSFTCIP